MNWLKVNEKVLTIYICLLVLSCSLGTLQDSSVLLRAWLFPKGLQDAIRVREERLNTHLSDFPPQSSFCFLLAPYLSPHPYLSASHITASSGWVQVPPPPPSQGEQYLGSMSICWYCLNLVPFQPSVICAKPVRSWKKLGFPWRPKGYGDCGLHRVTVQASAGDSGGEECPAFPVLSFHLHSHLLSTLSLYPTLSHLLQSTSTPPFLSYNFCSISLSLHSISLFKKINPESD